MSITNKFIAFLLMANSLFFSRCHDNFETTNWPSLHSNYPSSAQSAFIQQTESNSPSWNVFYSPTRENTPNNDGQIRPYRRYIFGNASPNFAKPPNPHSPWMLEQLRKGQQPSQELETFDGGIPIPRAEIPQALRNYFSLDTRPEKVVKELTGIDLHSIIDPALDHLLIGPTSTAASTWTRPTTPKDKLVEYFEKSLDNFLAGRFRPMERIPYLLENEGLMLAKTKNVTNNEKLPSINGTTAENNEPFEGSGEEPESKADEPIPSSISGIPKQMPFIPKMPADFLSRQKDGPTESVETIFTTDEKTKNRNEPKMERPEIRRHPINMMDALKPSQFGEKSWGIEERIPSKTMMDHFEYGTKPTYQQGVLGSVLDFFGINSPAGGTVELDQVLTDWLMEHSPKKLSKIERQKQSESSYNLMKQLLSEPVMPLCATQPEVIPQFNFNAFMGQWFEVMFSPLISSPSCTALSYRPLSQSGQPNDVGSIFQTLQFSIPKLNQTYQQFGMPLGQKIDEPQLGSGYGIVSRPGQIIFRKSNSPEEIIVHIIDAGFSKAFGRYEWAILGINCNYPIYVIARDPFIFKQKYERLVTLTLERKGLISEVSRMLNLVTALNPAHCQMPKSLLGP